MSISRPARCILSSAALPIRPRPQCRPFHSTPCSRRRSRFRSVKASEMGISEADAATKASLKPYTQEEWAELAQKYTPEQLKAIEAGEEAVDVKDIEVQGFLRMDPYRLPYVDDLSVIRPVLDKRPQYESTVPEDARPLNEEETFEEVSQWIDDTYKESLRNKPLGVAWDPRNPEALYDNNKTGAEGDSEEAWEPGPRGVDFMKLIEESSGMTGGGTSGSYATAPALPKVPEFVTEVDSEGERPDDAGALYTYLQKQTGITLEEIKRIYSKILVCHRVVNQTRLGKIQSFYALAASGNRQGRLGLGEGKATEMDDAMAMARVNSIRNMIPIPRYENRTIYGDVEAKVSGTVVQLKARPPGFGLRCQHNIFEIARVAGITDLAARTPRSRNRMNVCKAVWQALQSQRVPDEIARGRGRKLVDVRKVYYGGDQEVEEVYKEPVKRTQGRPWRKALRE